MVAWSFGDAFVARRALLVGHIAPSFGSLAFEHFWLCFKETRIWILHRLHRLLSYLVSW